MYGPRRPYDGPIHGEHPGSAMLTDAPGLKQEREAAGWSIPELSEATGYDAGLLQRLEDGQELVPRIAVSRISAVLGTTHTSVRQEGPGGITRLRDIEERIDA